MGLLKNLKTSVASPHEISVFKQRQIVDYTKKIDESVSVPKLLPPYIGNSIPADTLIGANPILALLQAQGSKRYFEWEFNPASDMVWQIAFKEAPANYVVVERLMLMGTDLIIESCEVGIFKISLVDEFGSIANSNVEFIGQTLSINYGTLLLVCTKDESLKHLAKLCLLAIFEHDSLYKALTGAVISTFGLQMSDMHVILNSSFNFKDWCEIYLEDEGWVKVWCHIDKVSKKSSSHENLKGHCQIKFYRNNKSKSSRNLLCFIPDCAYVQDIFFYNNCQGNCRLSPETTTEKFLNDTNMIKIVGNVSFPLEGFSKKNRSGSSSSMSFFSKNENRARSSSSVSSNTCSSPTQSPNLNRSSKLRMFSPSKKHQRSSSQVSTDSIYSTYKDLDNCTINPKGLMIRPLAHNGVNHLESMIRFALPMMDCMRMYGRPNRFKTERNDPESLMFGLPKLPTVDYFAIEEIEKLLNPEVWIEFTNSNDSNDASAVAMHWLSDLLSKRMSEDATRAEALTYNTLADVIPKSHDCYSFTDHISESVTTRSSPLV